jgi:hypothetical protein
MAAPFVSWVLLGENFVRAGTDGVDTSGVSLLRGVVLEVPKSSLPSALAVEISFVYPMVCDFFRCTILIIHLDTCLCLDI